MADALSDHLEELAGRNPKVMLLRVRRTRYVDATCLGVLEQFQQRFKNQGGTMILVGLTQEFQQQLTMSHLAERIGQKNLFPSDDQIFGAATKALDRARKLVALHRGSQSSEDRVTEAEVTSSEERVRVAARRLMSEISSCSRAFSW